MLGLLDLPNELLQQIVSYDVIYSSDGALLTLASLSARLNTICIPIYFSHQGSTCLTSHTNLDLHCGRAPPLRPNGDSDSESDGRDERDSLFALSIALQVPSIEVLDCQVGVLWGGPEEKRELLEKFERMTRVVDRLAYVGDVKLNVYNQQFHSSSHKSASGEPPGLTDWARVYGRLLDTILARSCHTLALSHGKLDIYRHDWDIPSDDAGTSASSGNRFQKLFSAFSKGKRTASTQHPQNVAPNEDLLGSLYLRAPYGRWVLKCANTSPGGFSTEDELDIRSAFTPNPTTLSNIKLRSLKLGSGMYLLPPCLNWTLSILRATCCPPSVHPTSPILTSLSLYQITLAGDLYRVVLPMVWSSVPLLRKLTIQSCPSIESDALAEFLDSCKELEEVVFSGVDNPNEQHPPVPTPTLPKLRKLVAPQSWITYLLRISSRPQASSESLPLPSLRSVVALVPNLSTTSALCITDAFKFLCRVNSLLRSPQNPRTELEDLAIYLELGAGIVWPIIAQLNVLDRARDMESGPVASVHLSQALSVPDILWIGLTGTLGSGPLKYRDKMVEWLRKFDRLKVLKLSVDADITGQSTWKSWTQTELVQQGELLVQFLKESHRGRGRIKVEIGSDVSWIDCGGGNDVQAPSSR
ncbi:hypothetical protein AX16_005331 [Volvariella volvacea WC 439]|nr:hypothetical protein AX16_005331 [Volvariella volvacea WC 439]